MKSERDDIYHGERSLWFLWLMGRRAGNARELPAPPQGTGLQTRNEPTTQIFGEGELCWNGAHVCAAGGDGLLKNLKR